MFANRFSLRAARRYQRRLDERNAIAGAPG
jgi:hypothetical protein